MLTGALLALTVAVTIARPVPLTAAGWTVAKPNSGNQLTTSSYWSYDMYTWGYGLDGRTGAVLTTSQSTTSVRAPGLEAWASVSGGNDSTCAITTAGALYCWGYNGFGQLGTGDTTDQHEPVRVGSTTWSAVSKGYVDTCAIKASNSTLWCWGYNPDGQIGNNTTASPVLTPTAVTTTGTQSWSSISLGQYFACGIKTDATLWCWGYNNSGQVGNGNTTSQAVPVQIAGSWTTVSAGANSSCAIKATVTTLWCWGESAYGQIGNGTTTPDVTSPVQIGSSTWSALAGARDHNCGLQTNGTIWCWGYGGEGGLGRGSTTDSNVPVQESTNSTAWTGLTSMSYGSCATRTGGALWCWGDNPDGELGIGTTTDSLVPVVSGTATDYTSLDGGDDYVCGVRSADSGLWCQGNAIFGKTGHDYYSPKVGAPTPLSPPTGGYASGSTGYEGGCGVRTAGTLWCWGDNSQGSAGQADLVDHIFPLQVGSATDWTQVSVGTWTACGIRTTTMYCWGDGAFNQFGTASTTDRTTPGAGPAGTWSSVSVGETHTCAISTAGALSCWGANSDGQVGNGGTSTATTPVALTVTGVSTWSYVSAGYYETCAIAATGANAGGLYCWGINSQGEVGNNATADVTSPLRIGTATWTSVEVGREHVCGVQSSVAGSLWCWGLNDKGQLGQGGAANTPANLKVPTRIGALTTWSDVSAGWSMSCATRTDSTVWCWGRDDDGELGDRGATTVTTPQQVPGLSATWVDAHTSTRATLAR